MSDSSDKISPELRSAIGAIILSALVGFVSWFVASTRADADQARHISDNDAMRPEIMARRDRELSDKFGAVLREQQQTNAAVQAQLQNLSHAIEVNHAEAVQSREHQDDAQRRTLEILIDLQNGRRR